MPEITVRDWEDTDLHEVASLTFNALQGSPFYSPDRTLEDVEGWLSWNHERFPASTVFLARIDGGLVGWLTVTVDVKPGTSETWRWVPYISLEARGREEGIARGLGRRMLIHSLMNAARDYDTVTLAVDVENASAYDLYVDVGFDVEYRIITHAWKSG